MTKDNSKAPYHWRFGHGYMPPVMMVKKPANLPPHLYFAPVPFAMPPPAYSPCGPPPPHTALSHSLAHVYPGPPIQFACTPGSRPVCRPKDGPWCIPQCKPVKSPEPAPTVTSVADSSDGESDAASTALTATSISSDATAVIVEVEKQESKSCCDKTKAKVTCKCTVDRTSKEKNKKQEKKPGPPPATKLPGGLRKGTAFLFTGKPCKLHIIHGSSIKLEDIRKGPKELKFKIYTIQDNSTVGELIHAIGGGVKGSVTQIWERGNGCWREGTELKKSTENADSRLRDLGWSEAGGSKKAPVWLYFKP